MARKMAKLRRQMAAATDYVKQLDKQLNLRRAAAQLARAQYAAAKADVVALFDYWESAKEERNFVRELSAGLLEENAQLRETIYSLRSKPPPGPVSLCDMCGYSYSPQQPSPSLCLASDHSTSSKSTAGHSSSSSSTTEDG